MSPANSITLKDLEKMKNPYETDVAKLFYHLNLDFYGLNEEIFDKKRNVIGEIDIICGFDDYIFFIEVTSKKDDIKIEADHWFSRWSDDKNISLVKSKVNLPDYKIKRIFVDLAHNNGDINLASLKHILKEDNNHYIYKDDIDYFKNNFNTIGKVARNDFFNYIKLPRKRLSRPIDAIKFYLDNIPAYSFIARVDELLETCYIQRRFNKDEGYQRALDHSRILSISQDIKNRKILAFPNSILVNSVNKISNDTLKKSDCPSTTTIQLPQSYCEFKVVDGQHRLLGFTRLNERTLKNSYLPVIAFEKMPSKEELKMFIDINSKQKKVDSNLVFLLKKEFPWTPNDKEYYEKIAVLVALDLDKKGSLKNKIYFGTAKEIRKEKPVKLSSFVYILKNNGFIRKNNPIWQKDHDDVDTPNKETRKVINSIRKILEDYKLYGKSFFLQLIGLRIIFRLIKVMEYNRFNQNITVNNEEIIEDLRKIMNEDIFEELKNSYGEGGANNSANYLCEKFIDQIPDKYSKLELNLRKIRYVKREKK